MPLLPENALPNVSFVYGGRPSATFLIDWPATTSERPSPGGVETVTVRRDPDTGLEVCTTARRFGRYGALDWVVEFANTGAVDSPILENILPLDATVPLGTYDSLRLHSANGSLMLMDDFEPHTEMITPGDSRRIAPRGGRSSSGAFPFMSLQGPEDGVVLAIGWSGQWAATIERSAEALTFRAGMERTRLYLQPGERIRTPRILVLPWQGKDADLGNNLLRRLLLEHYLPRIDGELAMPPSAQCLQSRFYLTGEAGEHIEMAALPKVADLGFEAYWIDACWYGTHQEWWAAVGSWTPNPQRFPNGLRPISDEAHRRGLKFILWFEPERVRTGTDIDLQHPDFVLRHPDIADNYLFNLGMPEARAWLTDLISNAITEHGIDIYRNDFNIDPLPFWQLNDTPDRVGMSEIRYVEGLYTFWDEIRRRHPNVWIDNCASGGRRIDLETCIRSLPLWPSDFPDIGGLATGMGLHVGDQCINAGLARWVPLFGGGCWNMTPYGSRSEI
ncbi:MAG: alpha-galactosidase, partial [Chloroflexi bacterium]|nr:alpha-galactosidase [Chloroflexota bacterium]